MSYAVTEAGAQEMRSALRQLEELNENIDQLAADAGDIRDICPEAKTLLDLAWFFTEQAYREAYGHCSIHPATGFCSCCHHYNELRAKAARIKGLI